MVADPVIIACCEGTPVSEALAVFAFGSQRPDVCDGAPLAASALAALLVAAKFV